ncbi:MAG: rhodanese-like domain-containing protein [Candidatus Peregrinibacteria bacterium]|nr:rhodanese-like domain-containing protein [Candidatus Peregrinibacteria bacterium]
MYKKTPKDLFAFVSFALICVIAFPQTVHAVPPPDFIFNIGSQIAQVASIAAIFLAAIFSVSYQFIKTKLALMQSNKIIFISISLVAIIGVSVGSAYLYGNYKQNLEYEKWLEESQKYTQLPAEEQQYLKKIPRQKTEENIAQIEETTAIDKLKIGDVPKISRQIKEENLKFVSTIKNPDKDTSIKFIEDYYKAIANQDLEKAYEMSKKSTSLATFKSWYVNTTKITLDNLVRIDDSTSSLELTLYEGDKYIRYGVLMKLKIQDNTPIQIANSNVRTLSEGKLVEKGDQIIAEKGDQPADFYSENQKNALSISNADFNKILKSNKNDYIVIDARENLEYENGYLQGSTHVRFADLQAGKWIELPENKYVYVLCWSGIRGKEVAEFLRTKNIVASYLENGANGWVEWGGSWIGNIKFAEKYSGEKYKKIFTTSEVKEKVENGVILVDSREPWKFENWHIEGSVNIPIMYTPTKDIEKAFAQVPQGSTVITICDDYVNCFDAKITAVELEERGIEFLGRYNKPWEYAQ